MSATSRRAIWRRDMAGVSLVEVLVSLVIVAIGLLGVSGLSVLSSRGVVDSSYRSVASQAAYEMADKIRTNRTALASYPSPNVIPTGAAPGTDCYTAVCTPVQQAAFDLILWAKSLTNAELAGIERARAARLPQAQAVVCQDPTPEDGAPGATGCPGVPNINDPWVIKIWWTERAINPTDVGNSGAVSARRYVLAFQP